MDSKLEISGRDTTSSSLITNATYKPISEEEMEVKPLTRPKSLAKSTSSVSETDRADEKMLPDEEKKVASNSNINTVEVKFTNNEKQNGDAKLDIGDLKPGYVGMGKEELMKYANDPFWVRLRWILFISFWLLWAGMLVGAIMIIVAAPKCVPPEPKTWWETGPLVEVSPSTSAEKLKELHSKDVTGVIVSLPDDPFDNITENSALKEFLERAKDIDVKIIVELSPVFSDFWFKQSENMEEDFKDYYYWLESTKGQNASGNPIPPNNWLISDDTSTWKYSDSRKQFYLIGGGHGTTHKPHLNFRIPSVVEHFTKVLTALFADNAQIAGVRLRGIPHLLVDASYMDEDITGRSEYTMNQYNFYTHKRTENLPEVGDVLIEWRDLVKTKLSEDSVDRVFMLSEELTTLEPFKVNGTLLVDLPRYERALRANVVEADRLVSDLKAAYVFLTGSWPAWKTSNNTFTNNLPSDVVNMVTFLLPGVPILNVTDSWNEELTTIRKSPSIMYGSHSFYEVANKTCLAFVRVHSGNPGYVVVLNPTNERVIVNIPQDIAMVTDEVTVQLFSANYNETGVGLKLKSDALKFPLSPESSVVLSYVPKGN